MKSMTIKDLLELIIRNELPLDTEIVMVGTKTEELPFMIYGCHYRSIRKEKRPRPQLIIEID